MDLYDALIQESLGLINEAPIRSLPLADSLPLWKTESEQQLIFQKDMAYELGGGGLPAVSALAFTSQPAEADRLLLYGPDLPQLQADSPYARLTILHIDDRDWQDDQQAYQLLRRMEYTRYHVHPQGFMIRISTSAGREPVRVSRRALQTVWIFPGWGSYFWMPITDIPRYRQQHYCLSLPRISPMNCWPKKLPAWKPSQVLWIKSSIIWSWTAAAAA